MGAPAALQEVMGGPLDLKVKDLAVVRRVPGAVTLRKMVQAKP